MKHTNEITPCPSCEDKLLQAHATLAEWFRSCVKTAYRDCHISWSYRDKINQNECFAEGKSKLQFPNSAHNKSDGSGKPCARALDLFRLCSNGMASWEWKYFKTIADEAKLRAEPIKWGGDWHTIGDSDHFELV